MVMDEAQTTAMCKQKRNWSTPLAVPFALWCVQSERSTNMYKATTTTVLTWPQAWSRSTAEG